MSFVPNHNKRMSIVFPESRTQHILCILHHIHVRSGVLQSGRLVSTILPGAGAFRFQVLFRSEQKPIRLQAGKLATESIFSNSGLDPYLPHGRYQAHPGLPRSGTSIWEVFSPPLCLLGGLRGLAQSGATWLCRGVDHRHKSAGGNPHLPAAGCAALEGESGTTGACGIPTWGCPAPQPHQGRASWERFPARASFVLEVQRRVGSVPSGQQCHLASS